MSDTISESHRQDIVVDRVFAHSPEKVWKALTTPELIARWIQMKPTGFAPAVGTQFTFQTTPAGEWDGIVRCQVLEAIPSERLVYSWKSGHPGNVGYGSSLDTKVSFSLAKVAEGTRVRLVHSGFVLPTNASAIKNLGEGWMRCARDIETIAGEQR